MLDTLNQLNQQRLAELGDPEIQTRIAQYEMAFRMQHSVPELIDWRSESEDTLAMYGDEVKTPGTFAASALLARRMVERGVRVVQILHRGWDQHGNIAGDLPAQCRDVDQPTAGLLQDLKQRGLLDSTLVVWGGEFGRTVYCQGGLTRENYGRDHHPRCFTMWMAGGGVRGGVSVGETDDYSTTLSIALSTSTTSMRPSCIAWASNTNASHFLSRARSTLDRCRTRRPDQGNTGVKQVERPKVGRPS